MSGMLLTYGIGWEKVQTALHTFLNDARSARLKKEREAVIRMRFAQLNQAIIAHCITIPRDATMDCRPVAFDLALQAELEPIANAPNSETVTRETFAAIVPQLVASWKAEQQQFLRSFLGRFITKVPRGVDILDLAISIVYTNKALDNVRWMRYPFILAEKFRYFNSDDGGEFPSSHYAAPVASSPQSRPYTLKYLEPKQVEVGIKWMRNIVAKLGLKPDSATLSDLEQCDARLRCLKCVEEGQGEEYAYTWEAAVSVLYCTLSSKGSGHWDEMLIPTCVPDSSRIRRNTTPLNPIKRIRGRRTVAGAASMRLTW